MAGCSSIIDGQASTAPITSVEGSLPSAAELQSILGAPLQADGTPKVGADSALRNDADEYTSIPACARVAHPLLKSTYQRMRLDRIAFGMWKTVKGPENATSGAVSIGIVETDSPASAESFYADSTASWEKCRGQMFEQRLPNTMVFRDHVSDVTESDGIVSAVLQVSDDIGVMTPTPQQRALGVVARYVVDVDVFGGDWPATGRGDKDRAAAVARLTLNKINASS